MLSSALGRHGARSGAVPEPPQTRPAAFGRIWDEVRRLREALELQSSVLKGSGKRWNCKNMVLEGSRRRWNYKNNVLEGSRRRWNYENSVLEGSRRRWIDKNNSFSDPVERHDPFQVAQQLLSGTPANHTFFI